MSDWRSRRRRRGRFRRSPAGHHLPKANDWSHEVRLVGAQHRHAIKKNKPSRRRTEGGR